MFDDEWEYKAVSTKDHNGVYMRHNVDTLEEWLNKLGEEGWELCGFNWSAAIFKRKVTMNPLMNRRT